MTLNLFRIFVQSTVLGSTEENDGVRYDSDFARIEELIKGNTFTRYLFFFVFQRFALILVLKVRFFWDQFSLLVWMNLPSLNFCVATGSLDYDYCCEQLFKLTASVEGYWDRDVMEAFIVFLIPFWSLLLKASFFLSKFDVEIARCFTLSYFTSVCRIFVWW